MAIRNLEIRKGGAGFPIGFLIFEQAGSNYHEEKQVYAAANAEDASNWLREQGGAPDLVEKALADAAAGERTFLEIAGNYLEAEGFPKR